MKNSKLFTILIFAGLILSCGQNKNPPKDNEQTRTKDTKDIKKTLMNMWDAIEKKDIPRYASYIHPNFTQFGEMDPKLLIGKEQEVNATKAWVENSSNIHTEMIDPRIIVKGDVAWITYYWSDNGITNGEHFESKGKSTRIFVKEDDQWLCIHGHYTLLPKDSIE